MPKNRNPSRHRPGPFALHFNANRPAVAFAAAEIVRAVEAAGGVCQRVEDGGVLDSTAGLRLVLACGSDEMSCMEGLLGARPPRSGSPESYALRVARRRSRTLVVMAADPVGAMYGGLDLAEAIRLGTIATLRDAECAPHVHRRGLKFNIPLDARTPSYSDASDSAQQNIPEVWSFAFWESYLDAMARHRFNVLTLWNLHPFPSLVKVPEFPEVALDDVMRTRARFDTTYSICGHDMVRPETLAQLDVVKRISIEEKIRFWRQVMQHAHDRGIAVYWFTWNIFTFGAEGKHGITHAQDNPQTIRYFRASVRELILTYPLLAGIGITAGERMSDRSDAWDRESWLWQAYGEGVRDALAIQPGRQVRLIHRYHQTALDSIMRVWARYPGPLDLSFKYAIAHMYSDPAPPFAREALRELPAGRRIWMTVRNDDQYCMRWGDPDFARAFVRALPGPDKLAGYYMGPDGYTWGRTFVNARVESPPPLVLNYHWYSFMLWGRLSYDPHLSNAHFRRVLAAHFPRINAATLFTALQCASRVIPQINRFHWEDFDFQWYPEACLSHPIQAVGFHTVRHFMDGRPMPGSGMLSIRAYVNATCKRRHVRGITPPQVVHALRREASAALAGAQTLRTARGRELRSTLGDIRSLAHLGRYYAAKIEGATALCRFDVTGVPASRDAAVRCLDAALVHWKAYAATAGRQYNPQLLNRVGPVDIRALVKAVRADIAIARHWVAGGGEGT